MSNGTTPKSAEQLPTNFYALAWKAASTFGVATVLLFAGGYWMARNVAEPMVESHRLFLLEQVRVAGEQAETLRQTNATLAKQTELLQEAQKIHEVQVRMMERLCNEQNGPKRAGAE